ncbi:hypothetical protein VaNZ11_013252, partial [Volvox africanus]
GGTLDAMPAAAPGDGVDGDEEGEDEDADADLLASMMVLPDDVSSIDPAVLSTLPTSLQLDILEKMRDAQMAANREKFQVAARVRPENFCAVQMATYLKASAFRQQLEEYKQNLGGGGQGTDGTQVRKIMSEEGREYILAREPEKPLDKQRPQRGGGLFGGSGGGGGGRRGGGNKHDQLAVAAAAASAARRNVGMTPKLAAAIPLAAFKGLPTAAPAPSASANSTVPAPPAAMAAAASDTHGPMDVHRRDGQSMGGTVARGAVLELNLSDPEVGSSGSARGMFGSSSSSSEDDAEGGIRVDANVTSIGSGRGGGGGGAAIAAAAPPRGGGLAGASSSAPNLDDVEWEDVEVEAAAPSMAAATIALTSGRPRDWRERMAVRQKLWSTSHGFRMGRKLADWGNADAEGQNPKGGGAGGAGGVNHGSAGQRRRKGYARTSARSSGSGGSKGGGDGNGEGQEVSASGEEEEEDSEEGDDALLQEAIRQSLQQQQNEQKKSEKSLKLRTEGAAEGSVMGSRKREAVGSARRTNLSAAEATAEEVAAEEVAAEAAAGSKWPLATQPSQRSQPSVPSVPITTGCVSDEDFEWEDVSASPEPAAQPLAAVAAATSIRAAFFPPPLAPTHGSPLGVAKASCRVRHPIGTAAVGSGGNHQPLVPRRGPLAAAMAGATGQPSVVVGGNGGGSGGSAAAAAAATAPPSYVFSDTQDAARGPDAAVTAANPRAGSEVAAGAAQRAATSDSVSDGEIIWEAADADVEILPEAMPAAPDGDVCRRGAGSAATAAAAAKHAPATTSAPLGCHPSGTGTASARDARAGSKGSSLPYAGLLAPRRLSATAAATAAKPMATDAATQQNVCGKEEPSHPAIAAGAGQQRETRGETTSGAAATTAVAATASSLISQINSSSIRRLLEISSSGGGLGCVATAVTVGAAKAAPLAYAGSGAPGGGGGKGDDDDDDDDDDDIDFSFAMKVQGVETVPWVSGVHSVSHTLPVSAADAPTAAAAAATSPDAVAIGKPAGAATAAAAMATAADPEASDDFDVDFSFVTGSRVGFASGFPAAVTLTTDTQHTNMPIAATAPAAAGAARAEATAVAAVSPAAAAAAAAAVSQAPSASADSSGDSDLDFNFVKGPPVPQPPSSAPPGAALECVASGLTTQGSQGLSPPAPCGVLGEHQPLNPLREERSQWRRQQPPEPHEPAAHPTPQPPASGPVRAPADVLMDSQVPLAGVGALGDADADIDAGEEAADDADWFDEDPDYVPDRDRHPAGGQTGQPPVATATNVTAASAAAATMAPPDRPPTRTFLRNEATAGTATGPAASEIPYGAFLPPPLPPGTWVAPMQAAISKPQPTPSPPPPLPPGQYGAAPAATVAAASATAPPPDSGTTVAGEGPSLDELLEEVEAEEQELRSVQARASRNLEAPTPEMYQECQELLQMFGLPFIVAPMEAEAQCAYLEIAGLVDGVVTDDNDVFLFGGRHVYRHIFENRKYVEEYQMADVERELGLTRERLADMALLLGSDYTEGCSGIGIVNAVEVVRAFPGRRGLERFRGWLESPDVGLLAAARQLAGEEAGEGDAQPDDTPAQREFKRHHRSVRKNWQLPASFPSSSVLEAYLQPRLDPNKTRFSFGRPDIQLLRQFCSDKFGWTSDKVDELLVPVLKEYDNRQAQLRMEQFLSFSTRFAKIRSKRLQNAVAGIRGQELGEELVLGDTLQLTPSRRKGSGGAAIAPGATTPSDDGGAGEGKADAVALGDGARELMMEVAAAGEQAEGGVRDRKRRGGGEGTNCKGGAKRARTV